MGILNYFEWSHITSCKNDTQNTFILSSIFPPHIRNFCYILKAFKFVINSYKMMNFTKKTSYADQIRLKLCIFTFKAVYFYFFYFLCLFQLVNDSPWCFLYFLIINIDLHEIRVNTKEGFLFSSPLVVFIYYLHKVLTFKKRDIISCQILVNHLNRFLFA